MKWIAIIAACCLLAAELCLGQSESVSTKPDSVKATVEVQNTGSDDASVTVTTGRDGQDTTVSISTSRECNRERPQLHERPAWARNWIIGFEVHSLDFKSFPGRMSLQRRISRRFCVGAGLSVRQSHYAPGEDYRPNDSMRYNREEKSWLVTVEPVIGYTVLSSGKFSSGLSLRPGLTRARSWLSTESRDERHNYYYWSTYSERNELSWNVSVPLYIERRFTVRRVPFSVGIISEMLYVTGGWSKEKTRSTQQSWYAPNSVITEDERIMRSPMYMYFRNPFQEYVRAYVKFYL